MCTSFVVKGYDHFFIGMNFDNNGMNFKVNTNKKDWFIVYVNTGKIKAPSFGVHKSGIFFNNLMTEPNEDGHYQRKKGYIHNNKLLASLIDGSISVDTFDEFLQTHTITNVPNWSTHNMITNSNGDTWIIEPGIGSKCFQLKNGENKVMTNYSELRQHDDIVCSRHHKASQLLTECQELTVDDIFKVLETVKQNDGEWRTDFSIVYDSSEQAVHYVEHQEFQHVSSYSF